MEIPRGVRNKNFWNVKRNPNYKISGEWLGQVGLDQGGSIDAPHSVFVDPAFSARATVRTIHNSMVTRGNDSLETFFKEYAPSDDKAANNNPVAYAKYVADQMKISWTDGLVLFDKKLQIVTLENMEQMFNMLDAMCQMEIGFQFAERYLANPILDYGVFMYNRDFGINP